MKSKINPEQMTDQEYIMSDPTWVKELLEAKNEPGEYFWRKELSDCDDTDES